MKMKRGRSITEKMFLAIVCMILIPIILLAFIEYAYTSSVMDRNANNYLSSVSNVLLCRMQDTINSIESVAFFVNGDDEIQGALIDDARLIDEGGTATYQNHDQIVKKLKNMSLLRTEINGVYIETATGGHHAYWKNRSHFEDSKIDFSDAVDGKWYSDSNNVLFIKEMYSYPDHKFLGMQIIDTDTRTLYELMSEIDFQGYGHVYLINEAGLILSTDQETLVGTMLEEDLIQYASEEERFYRSAYINGQINSVYVSKTLSNGWKVLLTIPREIFRRDIARIRNVTIFVSALIAVMAIVLSRIVSRKSTANIMQLKDAMDRFAQGDFTAHCDLETDNEIGDLAGTFNTMAEDINTLVNTVYEQKLMKQKAQMESLQLQINPHFLYNTLDTINWMARMNGSDEVGDMASSLGALMRYSLGKKSYVTIEEEIENLNNYLFIQNYRYGEKMEATIEIDPELYDYYIPKLLIQPILENAIVHGIEEKIDEGHIVVYAEKKDDDLFITVEDDGVGMTEEALLKIFSEDEKTRKKGHTSVGVVNVNKRLQMVYGTEYGLMIQSVLGAGTKMTMHLKAMKEAPDR